VEVPEEALADEIDELIASWHEVQPDRDVSPLAVTHRLQRLGGWITRELSEFQAGAGLAPGYWAVLAALRRDATARGLSQRELADRVGLTAAAVGGRLEAMARDGLVARRPDPQDGRATLITVTESGAELFEALAPSHLANLDRLLAPLDPSERDLLASLLRRLALEQETLAAPEPRPLGVVLLPASLTIRRLLAAGRPPSVGLIVDVVAPGGGGERAGLRPGDVIVRASGERVSSIADLQRASAARGGAAPSLELELSAVGGIRSVQAPVASLLHRRHPGGGEPRYLL
jgi:DNA-binding MarR family transcriptional regulator